MAVDTGTEGESNAPPARTRSFTAGLTKPIVTFRTTLLSAPFARWCTIVAVTLLIGSWIVVFGIPSLPGNDALIIHYTTTFGIDALGNWRDLLRLPLTGTVLLLVNLVIARLLATESGQPHHVSLPPSSQILIIANIPLQFTVLLGSVLLWRVNQ